MPRPSGGDHEHTGQLLAALAAIAGAGWIAYQLGQDNARSRCAVEVLECEINCWECRQGRHHRVA